MQKPMREWIWAELPTAINDRLAQWRDMFCQTVLFAEPVSNLHITLFHEVLKFEDNLRQIIAQVANTPPAFAQLGRIASFSVDENTLAIVVKVVSPDLEAMRRRLEKVIDYTMSVHSYSPHITLAKVPSMGISQSHIDQLRLHGIVGQEFTIDEVKAGTKLSNHTCPLLGHNGIVFQSDPEASAFVKDARGMSLLSGTTGGFLAQPDVERLPIDDDMDDDDLDDDLDDDEDEDDDHWIQTSMTLADSLDEQFGDF